MTAAERAKAKALTKMAANGNGVSELPPSLSVVDPPHAGVETSRAPLGAWERELVRARADIQRALGTSVLVKSEPLFSDAGDLLTRDFPLATWAVTGLITRGGIATIGGEPKTAKTWLALEIAIAIATGTKACGEFFAERGTVAYFFAEDLDVQVRNRIRSLLASRGMSADALGGRLHICPRGQFLDVMKDDDLARIVASCRTLGKLDLLVLDPLRDISSAAEDKSDEMSPVMRRLRLVGELLECTVAIVHHAGKTTADTSKRRPGQRLRGSSAIHGSTDSGIYLGNLDGDGANLFRNIVDSEVKGARSAGRFELTLTIEDNADGEAIRADAVVSRKTSRASEARDRDQADDDAVLAFVRSLAMRGEYLSRRALRDHDARPAKVSVKRVADALDRLLVADRLVLQESKVRIPDRPERARRGDDS